MRSNIKFWSIFLIIWILLTLYTLVVELSVKSTINVSNLVNIFLQVIGALGIYGLISNKKLLTLNFWKIFFKLQLGLVVIVILFVFLNPAKSSNSIVNLNYLIFIGFYGLYFYGLYLYSYKRPELWLASKNTLNSK